MSRDWVGLEVVEVGMGSSKLVTETEMSQTDLDGTELGSNEGIELGLLVGSLVGSSEGIELGSLLGTSEGSLDGIELGPLDGCTLREGSNEIDGTAEGIKVAPGAQLMLGIELGSELGRALGLVLGCKLIEGIDDGAVLGVWLGASVILRISTVSFV